jgi:hypothetical protein
MAPQETKGTIKRIQSVTASNSLIPPARHVEAFTAILSIFRQGAP